MKKVTGLLTAFAVMLISCSAFAQNPPDISRWTGNTALGQPQGFSQGDPLTLTWGFAQEGMTVPFDGTWGAQPNDIRAFLNGIYGSQAVWQPIFQSVFDRWSAVSGLSYQFEANDDGAGLPSTTSGGAVGVLGVRADLRIASKSLDGPGGVLAYNWFPNAGDMVIDSSDTFFNNTAGASLRMRNVVAHEHGHGVGMAHVNPNNGTFLMEQAINLGFDGPQYHDILIAHRGYGDVNEKSNGGFGNDTSANATDLGTLNDGDSVSIGNDARNLPVGANEVDFVSIDDQSDTDIYSIDVNQAGSLDVLLEALGQTYNIGPAGGPTGAWDTSIRSNLALAVLDTDGTTVLASIDATGLGGNETLNGVVLDAAGTYYIRVTGADNGDSESVDTQFYGLSASFTAAIPEPGSMAVLALCGFGLMIRRRRRS